MINFSSCICIKEFDKKTVFLYFLSKQYQSVQYQVGGGGGRSLEGLEEKEREKCGKVQSLILRTHVPREFTLRACSEDLSGESS